jgi:hypothetical protein
MPPQGGAGASAAWHDRRTSFHEADELGTVSAHVRDLVDAHTEKPLPVPTIPAGREG